MAKDHLENLITALAHLDEAVKNMGSNFKVARVEIADGKKGYHFDSVIRSSPSFHDAALYPDARNSPQVREIMGIKVEAIN
jgi:hypothetical protein